MTKVEATDRMKRCIAAIEKLPDNLKYVNACAECSKNAFGGEVHVHGERGALAAYADMAGLMVQVDENYTATSRAILALDENGTLLMQLESKDVSV